MRKTCSDHSNAGDSTVILLVPATGKEGGGKEKQKSESVREFADNFERVTGFHHGLAGDEMPGESQCFHGGQRGWIAQPSLLIFKA